VPRAVGIDLGTTTSVLAAIVDGRPVVLPNAEGYRGTPSVVAFTETGEPMVGLLASRQAILNPAGTVCSAKRFLDRPGCPYPPVEICALVLRKLVEDAARYLGDQVSGAVVAVPASGTAARRQATRDAGRLAGLTEVRLVDEPAAAAMSLCRDRRGTVLIVDLGGGVLDVGVLDVAGGAVEVRASAGDADLGGDDFDRRLVQHLAGEFHRAEGIDLLPDPRAVQRLLEAAARAKADLSSVTRTQVNLPFITAGTTGPRHLTTTVTRAAFDRLTADLVARCHDPVRRAMAEAAVTGPDLDEVILVGDSTRIPAVRALVRRLTGREPNPYPDSGPDPAEAVALGAAIAAGLPFRPAPARPAPAGAAPADIH
jgi:molecular chaperone DnaK